MTNDTHTNHYEMAPGQPIGMTLEECCNVLTAEARARVLCAYDPAGFMDFRTGKPRASITDVDFWREFRFGRARVNAFFQNLVIREYWDAEFKRLASVRYPTIGDDDDRN